MGGPLLIPEPTLVHVTQANTRPVANFSITPPTGSPRTLFVLNASLSRDAEDSLERLQFRWDFFVDDRWDVDWSPNPIATFEAGPPGGVQIRLEVRDPGLLTDSVVREVSIVGTSTPLLGWGVMVQVLFLRLVVVSVIVGLLYVGLRVVALRHAAWRTRRKGKREPPERRIDKD